MDKPTVGRIVHYVLPSGPDAGHHRPAVVVRVWDHPGRTSETMPLVQLQVFTDSGPNADSNDCLPQVMWATSVRHDEGGGIPGPGTWHWPERDS